MQNDSTQLSQRNSRRKFLRHTALGAAGAALSSSPLLLAQIAGERPARAAGITVLNPRARVPVALLIDDSTCPASHRRTVKGANSRLSAPANLSY